MRDFRTEAIVLVICGAVLSACGGNVARYERAGDRSFLGNIMIGSNAREIRMAEGIFQLAVQDNRDQNEISPTKMMLFFAAELTREKAYETFVILPSDERPFQPLEVKRLRARVLSGEFNEFMKKPSIKVKTRTVCRHGACAATYSSKAIVVMLKGDEKKKAYSLDANKVYAKLKPQIPVRPGQGS